MELASFYLTLLWFLSLTSVFIRMHRLSGGKMSSFLCLSEGSSTHTHTKKYCIASDCLSFYILKGGIWTQCRHKQWPTSKYCLHLCGRKYLSRPAGGSTLYLNTTDGLSLFLINNLFEKKIQLAHVWSTLGLVALILVPIMWRTLQKLGWHTLTDGWTLADGWILVWFVLGLRLQELLISI